MKRSDEIEALANRFSAHAASNVFPGHLALAKDIGEAVTFLRDYVAETQAKEYADDSRRGPRSG